MKKVLGMFLALCLMLQLLPVTAMTAGEAAYNQINSAETKSEVLSLLEGNLEALGLKEYETLFTQAFSIQEKEKIAYGLMGRNFPDNAAVTAAVQAAVADVVTPSDQDGEIILFDDFEQEGADINGRVPVIGAGTWSKTLANATSAILSGDKALVGSKSLLTQGATGNGSVSYMTEEDSYVITLYVYDSLTKNGNSNVTFDLLGASNFIIGFDIAAQYNAAWRGRGGTGTNQTLKDPDGKDILRKYGWNKLVFNVDAQRGTSIYINGVKASFGEGNIDSIHSVKGISITQRSGWCLSGIANKVYTDAVSIVKYDNPTIADASITQAVTGDATFTVAVDSHTDPMGLEAAYETKWYVKDRNAADSSYTYLETVEGLSYNPSQEDSGREFKAEVYAVNAMGMVSNTLTVTITESVFANLVKPTASDVRMTGNAVVGDKLKIEYGYSGEAEQGASIFNWYVDGAKVNSLQTQEIEVAMWMLGKTVRGEVIPVDNRGVKGQAYSTGEQAVTADIVSVFNSIETMKDADFALANYSTKLQIDKELEALNTTQRLNLSARLADMEKQFASVADIKAEVTAFLADPSNGEMNDIEALRWKFYEYLIGYNVPDAYDVNMRYIASRYDANVEKYLALLVPEGEEPLARKQIFTDLDVARTNIGSRRMTSAFERAAEMAQAYSCPYSQYYNDRSLLDAIFSVLEWLTYAKDENGYRWYNVDAWDFYYDRNNPMAPSPMAKGNWWNLEHGTPRQIIYVNTLLFDEMERYNPQLKEDMLKAVDYFTPNPAYSSGGVAGGNGAFTIFVVALTSILRGNPPISAEQLAHPRYTNPEKGDKLKACKARLEVQVDYSDGNGFHPDGSYVDHNYYAYTGEYGFVIYDFLGKLVYLFDESEYELSEEKTNMLFDWTFDSIEPMVYKANFMDMVRGRCVSGAGTGADGVHRAKVYIDPVLNIASVAEGETKERLLSLAKYMTESIYNVVGNDVFVSNYSPQPLFIHTATQMMDLLKDDSIISRGEVDRSQIIPDMCRIVHFRDNYGIGLPFYNKKIATHEDGGDFSNGWHTGEGTIFLYNDDVMQYNEDYWPTVNAYRMAGTTVSQNTGKSGVNGSNYAGGATIGTYTAAGMELKHPNTTLHANKSYFLFDDEIVMLGSDITSGDNKVVETIVENRKIKKDNSNVLTVNGNPVIPNLDDAADLEHVNWAHLSASEGDSAIGYYFPDGADLKAQRYEGKGKWSKVTSLSAPLPEDDTERVNNYVSFWFDHGNNPQKDTYSYALLPGKTAEEMAAYAENPAYRVLANDEAVQGVYHKTLGITAANFWTDTETEMAGIITSDKKASVIMQEKDGTLTIGVSDPTQENLDKIRIVVKKSIASVLSKDDRIEVVSFGVDGLVIDVDVQGAKGQTAVLTASTQEGEISGLPLVYDYEDGTFAGSFASTSEASRVQVAEIPGTDTKGLKIESNKSSGTATYDFEGDNALAGVGPNEKAMLKLSTDKAHSGEQSIKFGAGQGPTAGKISIKPGQYKVEAWFYDPGPSAKATAIIQPQNSSGTGVLAGVYGNAAPNNYVYRVSGWVSTSVPRSEGWHKVTFDCTSDAGLKTYIDDVLVGTEPSIKEIASIIICDYWDSGNTGNAYVDDLSITNPNAENPSIQVTYDMPFVTVKGALTVKGEFYTDYTGETAIYPFEVFANSSAKLLSAGFQGENIVLKTAEGPKALAKKAEGKNSFQAQVDTISGVFDLYVNGEKVLSDEPFASPVDFLAGISSSIEETTAVVYVDAISIEKTPEVAACTLEKVGDSQVKIVQNPDYKRDFVLIIATYQGKQLIQTELIQRAELKAEETIEIQKTVGETVKVFVWDAVNGQKPLSEVLRF